MWMITLVLVLAPFSVFLYGLICAGRHADDVEDEFDRVLPQRRQ